MRQFKPVRNLAHLAGLAFVRPFPDLGANALQRLFGLLSIQRTLPDNDHIPARVAPGLFVADVALDVLRPLLHPELDIGLRHGRILASVPVPETTAHVDYRLGARNDDIGPPGEALVAHPVPPTARKQAFAHEQFRQSVFTSDPAHAFMPLLPGERVHSLSRSHIPELFTTANTTVSKCTCGVWSQEFSSTLVLTIAPFFCSTVYLA